MKQQRKPRKEFTQHTTLKVNSTCKMSQNLLSHTNKPQKEKQQLNKEQNGGKIEGKKTELESSQVRTQRSMSRLQ